MSNDLSANAGDVLSGKEEDRSPEEIKARRAKLLSRITSSNLQDKIAAAAPTTVAKTDDKAVSEEFYVDTLQRFGITI